MSNCSLSSETKECAPEGFGPNTARAFSSPSLKNSRNPVYFDTCKRLIDILGSLVLLLILSPLMLVIALLVKLSSPGPVIYKQERLTCGGRIFTMYKFRSMSTNAESKSGAVWAEKNDPRVTPIGRFLRKTRIDELPQLVNVLIGDMSIIGPRPERPEIARNLIEDFPFFKRRLAVKGGITGLAQVSSEYAASVESYRSKLSLDRLYVARRSLWLDLYIAIKTFLVIFTGRGAR